VNRTYVQNDTSSLAVSADGFLYTDTTWEEGHGPAGTYHEGVALNKERRFLALRLDDAPIKGSLAQFRSLSFEVRRVSIRP